MRESEAPEVAYEIAFRVPDDHVFWDRAESLEDAIKRAAAGMLLRLTDEYVYDIQLQQDDPYRAHATVYRRDDPGEAPRSEQFQDALKAMARSLGQRCTNPEEGYSDELLIELHTDKEMLDVLVAQKCADSNDRSGKVTGYLLM